MWVGVRASYGVRVYAREAMCRACTSICVCVCACINIGTTLCYSWGVHPCGNHPLLPPVLQIPAQQPQLLNTTSTSLSLLPSHPSHTPQPKPCSEHFQGLHHYLGGRFLPRSLAEEYGLTIPTYPGSAQCVALRSPSGKEGEAKT